MAEYCGDEANLEYQADANLVGEFVHIKVNRWDKKSVSADGFQEITATKTDMKWPDQEVKGGSGHYGGRQVDFKGLNKRSYTDKFALQNFTLSAHHSYQTVESSATKTIDELPAAGPDPQNVGIPMQIEKWQKHVATNAAGVQTITYSLIPGFPLAANYFAQPAAKKANAGKFDIEHKDGVIVITVKIKLNSQTPGKSTKKAFKAIKKTVEAFWNSDSQGFNQWIYHREGCKRGKECNCAVVKRKEKYLAAGCCKVPFKVVIEEGGAGDSEVDLHFLNPSQSKEARANARATKGNTIQLPMNHPNFWGASGFGANSYTLSYPENRAGTYAHEVGHMLGFPDEYATGAVIPGAMSAAGPTGGSPWPISVSSVMGTSQTVAKKRHLEASWFNDWINSNVDTMKVIDKT